MINEEGTEVRLGPEGFENIAILGSAPTSVCRSELVYMGYVPIMLGSTAGPQV